MKLKCTNITIDEFETKCSLPYLCIRLMSEKEISEGDLFSDGLLADRHPHPLVTTRRKGANKLFLWRKSS